jgi:hypothetical protein
MNFHPTRVLFWRPLLFCRKGGQAMAKIRGILEYKWRKGKEPISCGHLEPANVRFGKEKSGRKSSIVQQKKSHWKSTDV